MQYEMVFGTVIDFGYSTVLVYLRKSIIFRPSNN